MIFVREVNFLTQKPFLYVKTSIVLDVKRIELQGVFICSSIDDLTRLSRF